MENKKVVGVFCFVLLILIGSVSAITGSIGNVRMILRAETGDVIEKYVLVKNVNNVSIDVEVFASGDLGDYIDVLDNNFTLAPGDEKKARFVVNVEEPGTTESSVNVKFTPIDGKNGVGLMSTVIVIAEKGSWFGWGNDEDFNSSITGKVAGSSGNVNLVFVLAILMVLVLIVLVVIFLVLVRKKNQLDGRRQKVGSSSLPSLKKNSKRGR